MKIYNDERINELIKKSFEIAVKDSEWQLRFLNEWNILFDNIDKIIAYVNNGKQGKLFVNSNIWWVLQETLINVLDLYDLQLIGENKVTENEEVISKFDTKCNLCNGNMVYHKCNDTHIWVCEQCPNIQFEYNDNTNLIELEKFILKRN